LRKERVCMQVRSTPEQAEVSLPSWTPRIVYIRASVTDLDSPLIQFAVLKHDPLPSFYSRREGLQYQQEDDSEAIRDIWNEPLKALPCEQRFFLLAWSALSNPSPRVVSVAGLSFGIATPGPQYKRWITTRAVGYRGELVAWCEMVDMSGAQEEIIEALFTEKRMIPLLPGRAACGCSSFKIA
jgi:hypothetical protein